MCVAPVGVLFLPRILLRGYRRGDQREEKGDENQAGETIPEAHKKVYRGRENAEKRKMRRKSMTAQQII